VLVVAGVLYALEFLADKIPFVDNLWDILHTFVRPVGAGALTIAGLIDLEPQVQVIVALLASVVALTSHSSKAGTRTVVNVTSPVENLSNILLSLAEDALVAALAFVALLYPLAANVITGTLLVLVLLFLPQLLRWGWFTLRAMLARLRGLVHQRRQPERLPPEHAALLETETPDISVRCRAQHIRHANGRQGYLSLVGPHLMFTYKRWFRMRSWQVDTQQVGTVAVRQRVLVTVLEVTRYDERQRPRIVRFVFTSDRVPLVEQVVGRLRQQIAT
jgi:hypothetical protein